MLRVDNASSSGIKPMQLFEASARPSASNGKPNSSNPLALLSPEERDLVVAYRAAKLSSESANDHTPNHEQQTPPQTAMNSAKLAVLSGRPVEQPVNNQSQSANDLPNGVVAFMVVEQMGTDAEFIPRTRVDIIA